LIGGKMIIESFKSEDVKKKINPDKFSVILLLGFSTSIDALAVGFSLSLICLHILLSLAIIVLLPAILPKASILEIAIKQAQF